MRSDTITHSGAATTQLKDLEDGSEKTQLDRNYVQLERDTIQTFYDITKKEVRDLELGVMAKDRLEDRLYSFDEIVTPNATEAVVSRLRRKLIAAHATARIATVRGIGYRLLPGEDVEVD